MPIYQTKGTLTGTIERENVAAADSYLRQDEMAKYLDEPLKSVVEAVRWSLGVDGHHYTIEAFATRELTTEELKELADWTSGQNSDGLGECFEQQEFAWIEDDSEVDCGECDGSGETEDGECEECGGLGYFEDGDSGCMISFDWKTNDSTYVRVV